MSTGGEDLELLFERLRAGDGPAREEVLSLLYDELRGIARRHMLRQSLDHTLQPTALVNEAYLRLCGEPGRAFADRKHFLQLASLAMRQVLVDHARAKQRQKREPNGMRVELEGLVEEYERRSGGLVELDEALARLERRDPEAAALIELRFFGGRSMEEAAELLGVSERQARRWWAAARLQLQEDLEGG